MLMKAKTTGQAISRVLVQTADWHYNEASQWWDMYSHCLTENAVHTYADGTTGKIRDGLIHPDFWIASQNYLRLYKYHTEIADRIMRTGQPVPRTVKAKVLPPFDPAGEFEKAVQQRGQIAAEAFKSRRRKSAQRPVDVQRSPNETNGQDTLETLH